MGELIGNIHTYVVPGGESYTFEMRWQYDSWNRLINIQYPDGEFVSYRYDNGGKLMRMNGEKLGQQYNYIKEIIYDKFDSRTFIHYGNGTYSEYYYDPLNRRLKNLKSYDASGHKMHDIDYGYDGVGNILDQSNHGEYVYNGAGGPYNYHYEYDELYRLIQSGGNFESNNGSMYYNLNMSYSPSGNITNKQLYGQTLINGGVNNIDYNRDYQYNGRPHQVTNAGENAYKWDGNGNMIFRRTPQGKRYQCWDNEDRLVAVHDEGDMPQLSAYLYDGGGERVWKLTGGVMQNYMNGQQIYNSVHLDKTLYASPYMVMTEQEYTKHYYIEGERICSKIGGGFQWKDNPPTSTPIDFIADDPHTCSMHLRDMVDRNTQCAEYDGEMDISPELAPAYNNGNNYENLQYFYHSDHLGSASFVTNAEGAVVQHLQYLPYGELFVSQRNSDEFDSRYKFTAKELDNETSYTYFGARYYDSELSGWLSVDPMSDKRSWVSPYAYCQWNPLVLVDPSGMLDWEPVVTESGDVKYLAEKGDNIYTFMSQYNLSFNQAKSIFENAGISNPVNNYGFAKSIETGTAIGGDAVKKVTGSEILKLDWNSSRATDQRKTDQIMFAIKKSQIDKKDFFDLKDFNYNIYNQGKGFNAQNVTIRVGNDRTDILNINVTTDWYTKIMSYSQPPNQDLITLIETWTFYSDASIKNPKSTRPMILIKMNSEASNKFAKYYY
jgi:RHS repeat-associated protein